MASELRPLFNTQAGPSAPEAHPCPHLLAGHPETAMQGLHPHALAAPQDTAALVPRVSQHACGLMHCPLAGRRHRSGSPQQSGSEAALLAVSGQRDFAKRPTSPSPDLPAAPESDVDPGQPLGACWACPLGCLGAASPLGVWPRSHWVCRN